MNRKIGKYIPFGIIMIIFGSLLFFLSGIDQFIRPFTQPILMGSSKGKDMTNAGGICRNVNSYSVGENVNWYSHY